MEKYVRRLMGMGAARNPRFALPVKVAAICYRRKGPAVELLLVQTNGGGKWTFPKGSPETNLSHRQAAEREAWEEGGVRGRIEARHFHVYLGSKGVFWKPPGIREFAVKAFLLEVTETGRALEPMRNPTWFAADEARELLAKGREIKYAHELQVAVDRALEEIGASREVAGG
jgi:8-oxo-dGTP pyrophosphatase MutT (NUDIX family)